jgi:Flp pilus assembly protein TadD
MKLSQIEPDEEELRVVMEAGFALCEMGRLDEAERLFRGVAALLPASPVPCVALGNVLLLRGHFAEAQTACEDALRLSPGNLYARVHHAEALLFQRRRGEAEEELHRVIATDPASPYSRTARSLLDAADLICGTI